MKPFVAMLCWTAVSLSCDWCRAVPPPGQDGLTIAVVPTRQSAGSAIIERGGVFRVVFTNRSAAAIRLWDERCRPGHETLSFRVEEGDGATSVMRKVAHEASAWKDQPPKTFTIPPGRTHSWDVKPSGFFWGDRTWKGVPEANTGKPVRMHAVFEIKASNAAKRHGVWTGRVTSEQLTALIVDPRLRTPHDYLKAGCPTQALRTMQADPAWVARANKQDETPLHIAVYCGLSDVARWLLTHGADVNARAYNRFTPLRLAKDPAMVQLLLEHKPDVNAKDAWGKTALEEAARIYAGLGRGPHVPTWREKWRRMTQLMLDAGAEYDIRTACYLNDARRVGALAADRKQARDQDAMRIAATFGRANLVKLLLAHGADPEHTNRDGLTVSYFAIEHPDVLRLLFDAGANPKVTLGRRSDRGGTLLHAAASARTLESAKLLLCYGVDTEATTAQGFTPLHNACLDGSATLVALLLSSGANGKARTKAGWTPMGLAADEIRPDKDADNARYEAVMHTLQRAGVEVDLFAAIARNDMGRVTSILRTDPKAGARKDPGGRPALHYAVRLGRKEIVKLLLAKGCDPAVRSEDESGYRGETALLEAAFWGRLEIARLLMDHGANVNARAEGGITALHVAASVQHVTVARLLLARGAAVNATDDEGKTPLDWATYDGPSEEMVRLLRGHGGRVKAAKP